MARRLIVTHCARKGFIISIYSPVHHIQFVHNQSLMFVLNNWEKLFTNIFISIHQHLNLNWNLEIWHILLYKFGQISGETWTEQVNMILKFTQRCAITSFEMGIVKLIVKFSGRFHFITNFKLWMAKMFASNTGKKKSMENENFPTLSMIFDFKRLERLNNGLKRK